MAEVKFDTSTYTFDALDKKYNHFFVPAFEVSVNGANLVNDMQVAISHLTVETTVEAKADSCVFHVVNAFDFTVMDFKWTDDYFFPGKHIDIKMGYGNRMDTVFSGIITSVVYEFEESDNPILIVKGMDFSFLMMHGVHSKTWHKKKYSDIVKEISGKYPLKLDVEATTLEIPTVVQNKMTDFHFLEHLSKLINYDFFVVGKQLIFRKALSSTTPVITLEWGKLLRDLSVDANISSQISQVIVRGWDEKELKAIEAKVTKVSKLGSNSKTGKDIIQGLGKYEEYEYTNSSSQKEAQERGEAILNRRAMQLVSGSGGCIGIPEMRAGRYVKFDHVGKRLGQIWYLTGVTHTIDESGYKTGFQIGGNAI